MLVVAGANNGFSFRQALEQFLLEVLCEAAGNDQLLALLGQFHQGANGLFPGVLNEAAGVDDHDVGVGFIGADPIAGLRQQSEHVLSVDAVLLAAEMRERHRFSSIWSGAIGHGGAQEGRPRAGQSLTLLIRIPATIPPTSGVLHREFIAPE